MLGKLLKYEFKSYSRFFLPLYALLFLVAVVNRLLSFGSATFGLPVEIIQGIGMAVYGFLILGIIVLTFIICIQRFYKSLFKEEGYLMHTLPVKSWKLITGSLIGSTAWTIFSFIAVVASVMVQALTPDIIRKISKELIPAIKIAFSMRGADLWLYIVEVAILMVLSIAAGFILIYISIAIGNMFSKNPVLASFGAYFVITTILQIISSIWTFGNMPWLEELAKNSDPFILMHQIFIVANLINIVTIGLGLFATNYVMKNKLNLN